MAHASPSPPLTALDAVVIDTETTGLDARSARMIQFGGIRIRGAELIESEQFATLLNPGVPIPPATTAIHGISDDDVRDAPGFAIAAGRIEAFQRDDVIVGHSIEFDLAILRREHELAGLPWRRPRVLDIRHLARIAAPQLAHYDLDRLCAWLDIDNDARHTAPGDARATARVFGALLPMLRQQGIRTLAEAEASSFRLAEQETRAAGGFMAAEAPGQAPRALLRIDSYPYRHRVRDVMSAPPLIVASEMPIAEGIRILVERKVSSAFIQGAGGETGIVTERDLLRAINSGGASILSSPLGSIMTTPLQSVPADAFLYRATARLDRLGFRHLGVHDADGRIVGALTLRNLLRQRASSALIVGDEIDSARNAADLASAFGKLAPMSDSLLAEDIDPRNVAAIISSEICAMTAKAAEFAEKRMAEAGEGTPPSAYCVLVLGSAGRGESLLAADQDNAIVFAHGEPGGREDRWFAAMAQHMNEILDEAGVVLCKGGVMARNQQWRHSLDGWKAVVDGWIGRQGAQDLLNVDIFFDGVAVHGDRSLGEAIWDFAHTRARQSPDFIKMLSLAAADWRPPLTMFGNIRVDENGRTDLKKGGLMPILIAGRALAIRHGVRERATPDRLRGVAAMGIGSPEEIEAMVDAHRIILGEILSQQLQDHAQGVPLSTRVEIRRLGKPQASALRKALNSAAAAVAMLDQGAM